MVYYQTFYDCHLLISRAINKKINLAWRATARLFDSFIYLLTAISFTDLVDFLEVHQKYHQYITQKYQFWTVKDFIHLLKNLLDQLNLQNLIIFFILMLEPCAVAVWF